MNEQRAAPKTKALRRGQIVQRPGELNTRVYYVTRGLLRSYVIDERGREHTYLFSPGGWYCADACEPTEPAELFIEALEDSEVEVLGKHAAVARHERLVLVKRISAMQRRILMLMSASALERYRYFESLYPELVQRVSQRLIASFLGVTPEALSKVRGEARRQGRS